MDDGHKTQDTSKETSTSTQYFLVFETRTTDLQLHRETSLYLRCQKAQRLCPSLNFWAPLKYVGDPFFTLTTIHCDLPAHLIAMSFTPPATVPLLVCIILISEIVFYIYFRCRLLPHANQRTQCHPYRDYPIDQRKQLLLRILNRMKHTCKVTQRCHKQVLQEFLLQWFRINPCNNSYTTKECFMVLSNAVASSLGSNTSLESCATDEQDSNDNEDGGGGGGVSSSVSANAADEVIMGSWTIPNLTKQDTDLFFAWAFFGKELADMTPDEQTELEALYVLIHQQCDGLYLEPGDSKQVQSHFIPRRLSLEDVSPIHRPLFIYVMIWLFKATVCRVFLVLMGFQRVMSQAGLVAWHRPARKDGSTLLPLLFFHGIAPAGLCFYIPMILYLIRDGRSAYLFENPPISYSMLSFHALTESETVEGVEEILAKTNHSQAALTLMGHSFGSCQLTWLLKSSLRERIQQFVLIDPVTILLSEPDVMNNFLYSQEMSKIRIVASSELFTEYYLRRHFSWYNSELWLDDVPPDVKVLVALSEHDEIINSPKVKQQLDICSDVCNIKQYAVIYWEHVGHAKCVSQPSMWKEIKSSMLLQELTLVQKS